MARFERAALAALFFATVAACNSIVGLDAFHDVDCDVCGDASAEGSIGAPQEEAGSFDAPVDQGIDVAEAAVDAGTDAADTGPGNLTGSDAGSSVDLRWPRWLMPNGQDSGLPNPASYTIVSGPNGGVIDKITSLSWGNLTTSGVTTLATAQAACAPPWRLPTRIELVSILDTSRSPPVNPAFSSMPETGFWTSSVTPTGASWTVDFSQGSIQAGAPAAAVLCIYVGDAGAP